MLQIHQESKLVNCLSNLLQIQKCAKTTSFYALMLPDHLHARLFQEVALLLETDEAEIREQFKLLTLKHLLRSTPQSPPPSEGLNASKCYNLVQNSPRTQSQDSILFQYKFAECLQKVIQLQESDNKKLCQEVVNYLQCNSSKIFWKEMHELIPEKSTVQLRESFQNSFKRLIHQEYLSQEDKVILKNLMIEMTDQKPAEIADNFMDLVKDKNYFKRNVVMYIINMKKQLINK
ncbi:Conserved_hypothetical protein [Hexamita inflata]|uniref:Uncharacterized protein n=1 Tax=Hexamita inflata TaxID=28002 RepID=A0AA86PMA4_9EUKA|nr:Conserved hypothetical protein [Hexamita inflata]CAI9942091.1 Conserved hypothetical protein [Hexamita inflata]